MKTSREFGYAYAEWGHTEKQDGFDGPVDVNAMLGGSVDIPEGDYRAMRNAKIEPDARQYWDGYNSYFTSLGAGMMGRKGGKSKTDAKTAAARENAKKGGRPPLCAECKERCEPGLKPVWMKYRKRDGLWHAIEVPLCIDHRNVGGVRYKGRYCTSAN